MASDGTLKFDTSLDSGGLQSGMGKVAGIAQQALGVFSGQMMTRAVDSLVNLGKTALSSVGALEQNVGGVETLFGDTADAVIAAADGRNVCQRLHEHGHELLGVPAPVPRR